MTEFKNIAPRAFSSSQKVAGDIWSRTKGDKVIWAIVILLTMVSVLVIYSSIGSLAYKTNKSTESYLFKQVGFVLLGVGFIYFAHRVITLNYSGAYNLRINCSGKFIDSDFNRRNSCTTYVYWKGQYETPDDDWCYSSDSFNIPGDYFFRLL